MIINDLIFLYKRDLIQLRKEIEAYPQESIIWEVRDGISNSAGNLCLHLVGNLNTYIGNRLGNTGYVRNREAEFSTTFVPLAELLKMTEEVSENIEKTFLSLSESQLATIYPEDVLGYPMTTLYFIIHLHGHLSYHLGQINYHRRLLSDKKDSALKV